MQNGGLICDANFHKEHSSFSVLFLLFIALSGSIFLEFIFPNIFNLQLFESADVEPANMKGQLYTFTLIDQAIPRNRILGKKFNHYTINLLNYPGEN